MWMGARARNSEELWCRAPIRLCGVICVTGVSCWLVRKSCGCDESWNYGQMQNDFVGGWWSPPVARDALRSGRRVGCSPRAGASSSSVCQRSESQERGRIGRLKSTSRHCDDEGKREMRRMVKSRTEAGLLQGVHRLLWLLRCWRWVVAAAGSGLALSLPRSTSRCCYC